MKRADTPEPAELWEETRVFEKTAVFHPGDLRREIPSAGVQMDEETRELPLISGRFAGREWKVEELRREEKEKSARRKSPLARRRVRFGAVMLAGAAACFVLLTASLTAQAALTEVNDRAVAAAAEVRQLRQENDRLRAETARLPDMGEAEEYAVETLGMQRFTREQVTYLTEQGEDRVTVLAVRRGQGFTHFCADCLDTLGAYLHG